ncbi:MAG: hypothetical protein M1826_006898 [Phylliscum demangeonii]|nr:MAG: hypothetical protein M1826_006898 [Phylliscum demangeonii]
MGPDALNHGLYCALCGSPLWSMEWVLNQSDDGRYGGPRGWILYTLPDTLTPDEMKVGDSHRKAGCLLPSEGLLCYAAAFDGTYGILVGSLADEVPVYRHDARTGFAAIPMHTACLSIAERIFERRQRPSARNAPAGGASGPQPTSLERLYDSVNRQSGSREGATGFAFAVNWPHGCYGAQACQGERGTWAPGDGTDWFCADPIHVPGLTAFLLAHLQPITTKDDNDDDNATASAASAASHQHSPTPPPSRLEGLPTELLEQLTSYLPFAATLALARTSTRLHARLLTQTWWREALIAGDAVAYLWDLDPAQCRAKDRDRHRHRHRHPADDQPWDWRALARSCLDLGCFHHAPPPGLRNRHRIWKIAVDV